MTTKIKLQFLFNWNTKVFHIFTRFFFYHSTMANRFHMFSTTVVTNHIFQTKLKMKTSKIHIKYLGKYKQMET